MNKFIPFLSIIRLSLKDFNWFSTINANDTRKITAIIFFLSGFSSLLYQTTWQRILTQEIGVDFLSITFIVTIFMIGLGFGALWGGKVSLGVSSKNLLKLYAIIEIAIGAFGFFSIQLIRWANKVNLSVCSNSVFCDFIINLLVLSIPTLLMGMTTPIVIHFLRDTIEDFGETIGIFYGINIIGAAIGSLSSIFLIELIKINGVIYLSATINIVIGAIFFIYGIKKLYIPKNFSDNVSLSSNQKNTRLNISLSCFECIKLKGAVFLFGFVNLSFQMIIFRILAFYFNPLPFLFPSILFVFLLCMGIGQAIGGVWVDKTQAKGNILMYLFIGGFSSLLIAVSIPFVVLDQLYANITVPILSILVTIILAIPFLIPTAFFSAYLPIVSRLLIRNIDEAGATFGGVLFWSTLGNIFGAFITPVFLFDTIGTIMTTIIVAWTCYSAVVLINNSKIISASKEKVVQTFLLQSGFIMLILFTIFFPKDYFNQSFSSIREISKDIGKSHPIEIFEGRTSVAPVYFDQQFPFRLVIRPFGLRASAAILDKGRIGVPHNALAVPQALDPKFRPKKILELGLGSGEFPYAVKELSSVEKVVIVELNPEVIKAFNKYSAPEIKSIFRHSKIELNIMDARRYIQKSLDRGEKFDVIQIGVQTDLKGSAGVSNLYSYEFFEQLTSLLSPDGVLIIEPYIAVVRVAFEFFEYGYTINGLSWVFMRNKPFPDGSNDLRVEDYIINLLNVSDISQINNIDTSRRLPIKGYVTQFNKRDVMTYFPKLCTDYDPLFEYYYLSALSKSYVRPTDLIYKIDDIKSKKIEYIFNPK